MPRAPGRLLSPPWSSDTKRRILLLFLDIPRASIQSIIADRRQQLEVAEGEDDEEEDIDSPAGGGIGVYAHGEVDQQKDRNVRDEKPVAPGARVAPSGGAGASAKDDQARKSPSHRRNRHGHRQHSMTTSGGGARRSHASLLRSLAKFAVGYVLAMVFFGATYIVVGAIVSGCEDAVANVMVAGDRMVTARISHLLHRNYINRGGPLGVSAPEAAGPRIGAALLQKLEQLVEYEGALMYGSTELGTKGLQSESGMETQRTLVLEDGCIGPWAAEEAEEKRMCPTFRKGVMAHGAHAAIGSYAEAVRSSMAFRDKHGREVTILHSPATDDVEKLDWHFLTRALVYSTQLYDDAAKECVRRALRPASAPSAPPTQPPSP